MTKSNRSEALIKAQEKYDVKRVKQERLPGTRLNDEDAAIVKKAIKLHGGSGKDTIIEALKLFIKSS